MPPHDLGQVHVGEDVAVEDDGDVVEVPLGVLHRAPRPEGSGLHRVTDLLAESAAVAEDRLHPLGAVRDREDHFGHPGLAEQVKLVSEEGTIHHRDDRLGQRQRQRAQPRALASGQDDGLHQLTMGESA